MKKINVLKKNLKKKMLNIIKKPILLLIGKKSIIKTRLIEQLNNKLSSFNI